MTDLPRYPSLAAFAAGPRPGLAGPVALILAEDAVEIDSTIRHLRQAGFASVILASPEGIDPAPHMAERVWRITADPRGPEAAAEIVNAVIAAAPGQWLHYCYNAEYLFYPFCETRRIAEMLRFHAEERREAMLTYVVDLYAPDLGRHPLAVDLDSAHLDRSGYYALARTDPENGYQPKERQLDFYGGLRWRFEEHVPWERRRIDRIGLFKCRKGLRLLPDHRLNDEEMNTFACPWHHNLTAAICSFRTAKALRRNPGSRRAIDSFAWHGSAPFAWESGQLMKLGLMEPGQWF